MRRQIAVILTILISVFLFSSCTAYTYFPGGVDEDTFVAESETVAESVYEDMGSVTYLEGVRELSEEEADAFFKEIYPDGIPGETEPFEFTRDLSRDCEDGEDVLKLQERLIELGYLETEEPTMHFGSETRNAVALFQELNGLTPDGIAGKTTTDLLFTDVEPFADAFDRVAPTTHMSFAELVGDNGIYEYPEGYPSPDTYKIIVDMENKVTMVYTKDANGEYTVPVRYMLCTPGLDDNTPTGNFKMDSYRVRFSIFVRDGRYGQYWTQIRRAIYFHTMLYSAQDASTYIEDTWYELGTKASHGCVRLCVPDARWMWYNIAPGTECEIRREGDSSVIAAAVREKLKLAQPPEERLDLTPGDIPYTDNWRIEDVPHDVPFVQGSQY